MSRARFGLLALALIALLAVGSSLIAGFVGGPAAHAGTYQQPSSIVGKGPTTLPAVHKEIAADGTCEVVDGNGVSLYDSQFKERTGSDPCQQFDSLG
jgi:hypothetical protein